MSQRQSDLGQYAASIKRLLALVGPGHGCEPVPLRGSAGPLTEQALSTTLEELEHVRGGLHIRQRDMLSLKRGSVDLETVRPLTSHLPKSRLRRCGPPADGPAPKALTPPFASSRRSHRTCTAVCWTTGPGVSSPS